MAYLNKRKFKMFLAEYDITQSKFAKTLKPKLANSRLSLIVNNKIGTGNRTMGRILKGIAKISKKKVDVNDYFSVSIN